MDYCNFKIHVPRMLAQNEFEIHVEDSPAGITTDQSSLTNSLSTIVLSTQDGATYEEIGKTLFDALFTKKIAGLYRKSLGLAESQAKGLRIRLRIDPPELAVLSWELLYDPVEESFLATSPLTLLSRYQSEAPVVEKIKIDQLRILIVVSDPSPESLRQNELAIINFKREVELIESALHRLVSKGIPVELHVLTQATLNNLQLELARGYHVLHYIGHGAFTGEEPFLLLVDDKRNCKLVDGKNLSLLFRGRTDLRLVVLNSCQGAAVSSFNALNGMAPMLMQRGIPAVIAHREIVEDSLAIMFAAGFYEFLAEGFPLDVALNEARLRLAIATQGRTGEFANPVAYMADDDGILFESPRWDRFYREREQLRDLKNDLITRIGRTREFRISLFNLNIFSLFLQDTENIIGAKLGVSLDEQILETLPRPFCTACLTPPILQWREVENVNEYGVAIKTLDEHGQMLTLWEGRVAKPEPIDCSLLELSWRANQTYWWQVSYWQGNDFIINNGLFWLLDDDQRREYEKLSQAFATEDGDIATELALLSVYFQFGLYDAILAKASALLEHYPAAKRQIPLYGALIETYKSIYKKLLDEKMMAEADQALKALEIYDRRLKELYAVKLGLGSSAEIQAD